MLLLLLLELLFFSGKDFLLVLFLNLGFSFLNVFQFFFDQFLLLLFFISLLLLHSLINQLLGEFEGRPNDLLGSHLALYPQNQPHQHVIQLVANQLQLVDEEVILFREQTVLEA